jgi:hypothetical protein
LRERLLAAALKPYKVHGHGELVATELAISIDISKIPDLCEDFLG